MKVTYEEVKTDFLNHALSWAQQYDTVCLLQSNGSDSYSKLDWVMAVGVQSAVESDGRDTISKIEAFKTKNSDHWIFGFFSYDFNNEIENLSTANQKHIPFPNAYFFVPQYLLIYKEDRLTIQSDSHCDAVYRDIYSYPLESVINNENSPVKVKARMSKSEYGYAFDKLKDHIKRGNIYEVNLCQEFYAEHCTINPLQLYQILSEMSPTPFATFFKWNKDYYVLSASPERFLAKRQERLISQPIKGTAKRGQSETEDLAIKKKLSTDQKEISENVMIVDLVRNDLTRSSVPGGVMVNKLLEIQSFKQVHQLVSTISCIKKPTLSNLDCIINAFPAGSMTGAPKISAMKLIDQYEMSARGIYSGAIGYFSPNGDFDFNVVIRSILYDLKNQYLSFHTGGAVTYAADVEQEYQECILKAKAILKALNSTF